MSKPHGCDTCEMRTPQNCKHLCEPPSAENPNGFDAWQPRHYSSFRKYDDKVKAWVWDERQTKGNWQ